MNTVYIYYYSFTFNFSALNFFYALPSPSPDRCFSFLFLTDFLIQGLIAQAGFELIILPNTRTTGMPSFFAVTEVLTFFFPFV